MAEKSEICEKEIEKESNENVECIQVKSKENFAVGDLINMKITSQMRQTYEVKLSGPNGIKEIISLKEYNRRNNDIINGK